MNNGWICAKCGMSWSPTTEGCISCNKAIGEPVLIPHPGAPVTPFFVVSDPIKPPYVVTCKDRAEPTANPHLDLMEKVKC